MKWILGILNLAFALVFIPALRHWMKKDLQKDSRQYKLKDDRSIMWFSNVYLGICFCIGVVNGVWWFLS